MDTGTNEFYFERTWLDMDLFKFGFWWSNSSSKGDKSNEQGLFWFWVMVVRLIYWGAELSSMVGFVGTLGCGLYVID